MWRGLLGIEGQTLAEKRAAVNGTSLFYTIALWMDCLVSIELRPADGSMASHSGG
jgi:hypothetical protein